MKPKMIALALTILAVIVLVTACSSGATTTTAPSSTTLDGATLFQERCSVCHNLPTQARGTADQWTTVVQSMVARGANLSAAEQKLVIDYLATNQGK
jgi:mono/diheme cytochrome c family protein